MRPSVQSNESLLDRGLWWLQARWPRLHRQMADPSAALFTRIRLRLVAWFTGILVAILVIAGVALYVSTQAIVLAPVTRALQEDAASFGAVWRNTGIVPCASHVFVASGETNSVGVLPSYVSCYDASGQFLSNDPIPAQSTAYETTQFDNANLAQTALTNGSASDTIDGGTGIGAIERYALTMRDANGTILGVVQVGYAIQPYENSLHTLSVLLVLVGALALVAAGLGGWFLSDRALAPARLAAERQRAFIADAAHELRTPLTLLRADAEALLIHRDRLLSDDAELLDDIVAESANMAQLADHLLALARLDTGASHRETEIVDASALLTRAARRAQALADQRQIAIEVSTPKPVYVVGDSALLEQAILILLDNAIKYNQPGGRVTLAAQQRDQWARIDVRDTGVGIAAAQLAHLGERFYRVDAAHTRETGGAGLGVSIARGIAAAHQGALIYSSALQQGTTATLLLPAAAVRRPTLRALA